MLNLKGHKENGVVILDEPKIVNVADLKKEYKDGVYLMDSDGDMDENCCIKIYAYCDLENSKNIRELASKSNGKYMTMFIGGKYAL